MIRVTLPNGTTVEVPGEASNVVVHGETNGAPVRIIAGKVYINWACVAALYVAPVAQQPRGSQ